jgi:hypothetical protein
VSHDVRRLWSRPGYEPFRRRKVLKLGPRPTRKNSRSTLSAYPPLEARSAHVVFAGERGDLDSALGKHWVGLRDSLTTASGRATRIRISSISIIRGRGSRFLRSPIAPEMTPVLSCERMTGNVRRGCAASVMIAHVTASPTAACMQARAPLGRVNPRLRGPNITLVGGGRHAAP